VCWGVALTELKKGLFATEVGTMRAPETVAAVFDRMQTLIENMRRWVRPAVHPGQGGYSFDLNTT
jgi:hypothetical protein